MALPTQVKNPPLVCTAEKLQIKDTHEDCRPPPIHRPQTEDDERVPRINSRNMLSPVRSTVSHMIWIVALLVGAVIVATSRDTDDDVYWVEYFSNEDT